MAEPDAIEVNLGRIRRALERARMANIASAQPINPLRPLSTATARQPASGPNPEPRSAETAGPTKRGFLGQLFGLFGRKS